MDLDRSGEIWEYRPSSHKTEHHDKKRVIFVGPKAQAVLFPYLERDAEVFCFSPVDSEAEAACGNAGQAENPRPAEPEMPAKTLAEAQAVRTV